MVDGEIGSMTPSNIGVSTVDHNVDRLAGTRSRQQWENIEERQAHKMSVLRQHVGATGFDLSATPEGDYRVMGGEERQVKDNFRKSHNERLAKLARQRRAGIA